MVIHVGNGHGEMSSILDARACILHSANTLTKRMNKTVRPPALDNSRAD